MYNKTIWENKKTPVDNINLNHIEDGIEKISIETDANIKSIANISKEISDARNGEINLDTRLDKIDVEVNRQKDVDTDFEKRIEKNTNEINNARGGKASLDVKIKTIDAELDRQDKKHVSDVEILTTSINETRHQSDANKKHLVNVDTTLKLHQEELLRQDTEHDADRTLTTASIGELFHQTNALKKANMTMVELGAENSAEIVRNTIPSGFTQLSEIDFTKENNGTITLKNESVAYLNGFEVKIPEGTVINVGDAPEAKPREDLIFLEAWKDNLFARTGKLSWRIRVAPNIDFDKVWQQANEGADKYIGLNSDGSSYPNIIPQGGNVEPITNTNWRTVFQNRCSQSSNKHNIPSGGDSGLWSNLSAPEYKESEKALFKTLDGFVYAIPMFRLYRKPSCGKAIPFEYQKINPKVDNNKFSNLMREEKVERVITENIGGVSLLNYVDSALGAFTMKDMETYWGKTYSYLQGYNGINGNTTYTLVLDFELTNTNHDMIDSIMIGTAASISPYSSNYRLNKLKSGKSITKFTTPSDLVIKGFSFQFVVEKTNSITKPNLIINNCMLLEGDWTNRPLPKYFTGLKSLGEDEGNLIEVQCGILDESSYDPTTGTPKLNTVLGVNHISSDNLIIPTIEAEVKRGKVKVSNLTSFDKVDNLVGDEKVEFTKIKGRTLQNIITGLYGKSNLWTETTKGYSLDLPIGSGQPTMYFKFAYTLKPSTVYTLIFNITEYTSGFAHFSFMDNTNITIVSTNEYFINEKGVVIVTLTTKPDVGAGSLRIIPRNGLYNKYTISKEIMILEGDYTTTPLDQLPYINGIKSVGENEANKINLIRYSEDAAYNVSIINGKGLISDSGEVYDTLSRSVTDFIPIDSTNQYLLETDSPLYGAFCYYTASKNFIKSFSSNQFTPPTNAKYARFAFGRDTRYVKLYKLPLKGEYKYKQEITLKEPLRSLPNGTCDTIEGNKVVRRVGKVLVDGSEAWIATGFNGHVTRNTFECRLPNPGEHIKEPLSILCSNTPTSITNGIPNEGGVRISQSNNTNYILFSPTTALIPYRDLVAWKAWLSQNPSTLYYELATHVIEDIEPNYDKESTKTYQLDAPLRALPNGVKDEIVGNKLIRRCGEVILNGSEGWGSNTSPVTTLTKRYITPSNFLINSSSSAPNTFINDKVVSSIWSESLPLGISVTKDIIFAYNNTKNTVDEFKDWLRASPIKLIYQLAVPIEIPLKEVMGYTADFSLSRQFKEGNWLRELPNGIKDTIDVNKKVIRKIDKMTLNGDESWNLDSTQLTNTVSCYFDISLGKRGGSVISNNGLNNSVDYTISDVDSIHSLTNGTNFRVCIRLSKSKLSSANLVGFKSWLQANPVSILYELQEKKVEGLSSNNYTYYPCHELGTYCGSMYVGDGTNDAYVKNGLRNVSVKTNTTFRSITNKVIVSDCKYKKHPDGQDLITIGAGNKIFKSELGHFYAGNIETDIRKKINYLGVARVLPNKTYKLSYKDINVLHAEFYTSSLTFIREPFIVSRDFITTPSNCHYILIRTHVAPGITTGEFNNPFTSIEDFKRKVFLVDLEDELIYKPYSPVEVAFENIESSDIEDLSHQVSLSGFNYEQILNESFNKLVRGEL